MLKMQYFVLKPEAQRSRDNWHHEASRHAMMAYADYLVKHFPHEEEAIGVANGIYEWLGKFGSRS